MSRRMHEAQAHEEELAPAARALCRAERQRERAGHENAGFLSVAHGFTPVSSPLTRLDARFAAWDDVAAELPQRYPQLTVRRAIESLPLLAATREVLPDAQLLRACALLGMLAHAYWYGDARPPLGLPEVIARPWATARARLGRAQPVLSYIDLIVYNHRLKDPCGPRRLTLENLELLFPTIGNQEERVFYLTQLEILARAAPLVQLSATAQRAALQDDPQTLARCLEKVADCLRELVVHALPKIEPRRTRPTYVDPVVWAKTVAPFAVPFERNLQGPSGTSSPLFSLLDVLFGRAEFQSFLGREMRQLREAYPPAWRAFLHALSQVSVSAYVERSTDLPLRAAWREALQLYTGPRGFLARHRMKVYGYLEQAFKVGRNVTIGGFAGLFRERTWDTVDDALRDAHDERPSVTRATRSQGPGVAHRTPQRELQSYSITQLAEHNTPARGLWIAVEGAVYDVSRFIEAHPGGTHTLAAYAGMDASRAFARVHGARTGIRGKLERLRIGTLRQPRFEDARVASAHHALAQGLDVVVEMQNALQADRSFRLQREGHATAYELQRALETHLRFLEQYLRPLTHTVLPELLQRTAATLGVVLQTDTATHALASTLFHDMERWPEGWLSGVVTAWLDRDAALLSTLKARMRVALEALEGGAYPTGDDSVWTRIGQVLGELPADVRDYHARLASVGPAPEDYARPGPV